MSDTLAMPDNRPYVRCRFRLAAAGSGRSSTELCSATAATATATRHMRLFR